MNNSSWDVIIVGGGIMGSSLAYHLTRADNRVKVAVVERDPSYSKSSTTLSMAGVRLQFGIKENVLISMHAMNVFSTFEQDMAVEGETPDIAFRQEGYLFLIDEPNRAAAERALAMQQALGCPVEWWTPKQITDHYPLYRPDGFVGGTFGPKDGHIDAYAVLMGYRSKARAQGTTYFKAEAVTVRTAGGRVTGVDLESGEQLTAPIVVNCAGAWGGEVAKTAGVDIPVVPVKRNIYALDTEVKPDGPLPLTILPNTLYFRTEVGGLILLGKSLPEDKVGFDFVWERDRFQDTLWPELVEIVPAWESLRLVRGWAGLYEVNTMDENSILGEWPELKGFYLVNGFSGHGLQQGPAVGRYICELILGTPPTLDLSIFGPTRILENKPLREIGIV
ncbi:MAG: FAD-binding oxidoreductase [Deltaproteobacteria bacterium]|nr:FAD-binding oxidoreductase [Deltaproteobacteria bacterium]